MNSFPSRTSGPTTRRVITPAPSTTGDITPSVVSPSLHGACVALCFPERDIPAPRRRAGTGSVSNRAAPEPSHPHGRGHCGGPSTTAPVPIAGVAAGAAHLGRHVFANDEKGIAHDLDLTPAGALRTQTTGRPVSQSPRRLDLRIATQEVMQTSLHIPAKGHPAMGSNYDPEETAVMDINVAKQRLIERLKADGRFCPKDRAAIAALETPVSEIASRFQIRRNFERVMRNGVNRYTKSNGTDAGIVFVTKGTRLHNVLAFPDAEKRQNRGNGPDAA